MQRQCHQLQGTMFGLLHGAGEGTDFSSPRNYTSASEA